MIWRAFPFLEVLRPKPGQRVDRAVLASYSAEPVVLIAAMLALCDFEDDVPSRTARVEALLSLRGKVQFLLQRGRLQAPRHPSPALTMLDRYVRFIELDEEYQSWHPKVSWVQLSDPKELRIWLGSRNLTSDRSWDLGISLLGSDEGGPAPDGLSELVVALAANAGVNGPKVDDFRWTAPPEVDLERIDFFVPDQPRELTLLSAADDLLALSPFVDRQSLAKLSGVTDRTLVTTPETARELGPEALRDWRVLTLAMPDVEPRPPDPDDESGPESWALHAKAILARAGERVHVQLGSSNLTRRAWTRNAEVVARFTTGREWLDEIPPTPQRARGRGERR